MITDAEKSAILRRAGVDPNLVEDLWEEERGRTVAVRYRSYLGVGDTEYVVLLYYAPRDAK